MALSLQKSCYGQTITIGHTSKQLDTDVYWVYECVRVCKCAKSPEPHAPCSSLRAELFVLAFTGLKHFISSC